MAVRRDVLRACAFLAAGVAVGDAGSAEAAAVSDSKLPIYGGAAGATVASRATHPGRGHTLITWAVDTELRTFKVKRNKDGTFRLTRRDHGAFLTNDGQSPGACETHGRHGSTVPAGKTGHFRGYLIGTISGGTFDPNATCPANCGDTDVFIATFFGPTATFSCFTDSSDCKFNFQYHAPRQGLKYHHWYDKGKGAGTLLHEKFRGDIASA